MLVWLLTELILLLLKHREFLLAWETLSNRSSFFVSPPYENVIHFSVADLKAFITLLMLNGHLESECSRKMVDCPFQDVGCKTLVRKDDISSHNLTTVGEHSVLLLNQTKELSDVIQNMECKRGEVYRIKEQVVEHRTKLSELRTEIQRLCTHMCHTGDQPSVLSQKQNKQVHDTVEQQTKTLSSFQEKLKSLETNIHTYEGVITVLNNQIEQDARTMHTMQTQAIQHVDRIQALERKVSAQDQLLKELALAKQDNTMSEMASHDGELVWKITNFLKKRNDAVSRKTVSIYSPCFYTSRHGYKMCARIYLNGDGMGKGNHVSLFFVIMKGQFDALLRWPFRQKVTLMWLDQNNREHVIDAFRPDPTSSSFKRPEQDMNVASGCPLFMPLTELNSSRHAYVKDDVAFIKIIVDTTDIT
uniref:TNF receptor-associated factor 2-like n=1 Tax=Saccoglossus kowalevskii TaxID=10224 RepID=A0ABM0H1Y8_SACKO|nr:PREDICTED: TNF receptor-associated factor 2-like [Saccoglossus kowalevskii]